MNRIELIGNIGQDPEMNYTENGKAVTKFSIAVNKFAGKDKDGNSTYKTQWFKIVAWDKLAEICNEHLKKGAKVFVAGELVINDYTDRDGVPRKYIDVHIRDMEMLTPKNGNSAKKSGVPDLDELDDHPF